MSRQERSCRACSATTELIVLLLDRLEFAFAGCHRAEEESIGIYGSEHVCVRSSPTVRVVHRMFVPRDGTVGPRLAWL